jgi:hypothetical protein
MESDNNQPLMPANKASNFFNTQQPKFASTKKTTEIYNPTLVPSAQSKPVEQKSNFFKPNGADVILNYNKNNIENNTKPEFNRAQNSEVTLKPEFNRAQNITNDLVPKIIKTDSSSLANNNVNDIFGRNKEIMTLEEKSRQLNMNAKDLPKMATPTIINNYSTNSNGGGGGGMSTRDPLENLKLDYRSLPAWRTQLG